MRATSPRITNSGKIIIYPISNSKNQRHTSPPLSIKLLSQMKKHSCSKSRILTPPSTPNNSPTRQAISSHPLSLKSSSTNYTRLWRRRECCWKRGTIFLLRRRTHRMELASKTVCKLSHKKWTISAWRTSTIMTSANITYCWKITATGGVCSKGYLNTLALKKTKSKNSQD